MALVSVNLQTAIHHQIVFSTKQKMLYMQSLWLVNSVLTTQIKAPIEKPTIHQDVQLNMHLIFSLFKIYLYALCMFSGQGLKREIYIHYTSVLIHFHDTS